MRSDEFGTVIRRDAADAPPLSSDGFTVEAWIAPRAYPWNNCPIITQLDGDKAFYFGINFQGQLQLHAMVENKWMMCESRTALPGLNESLRFPDEFVRHKVLDLIGDLALLGVPLRAHVIAFKGGHGTHAELVGALLASREAWTMRSSDDHLPQEQLARFAHLTQHVLPRQPALSV